MTSSKHHRFESLIISNQKSVINAPTVMAIFDPNNTIDILAIGDSQDMMKTTDTPDDLIRQLQEAINQSKVSIDDTTENTHLIDADALMVKLMVLITNRDTEIMDHGINLGGTKNVR